MHLVTRRHFRSRDKDSGHTIRSAIAKNPMLHANFTALCVIEPELLLIEDLQCGNRYFQPFVTLTLTRWPSYTNLTRIPSRCTEGPKTKKMIVLHQGFRMLSYYRETDRQTDSRRNYIPSRFAGDQSVLCKIMYAVDWWKISSDEIAGSRGAAWHNCLSAISHYSDLSHAITWRVVYAAYKRRPAAENTRVLQSAALHSLETDRIQEAGHL